MNPNIPSFALDNFEGPLDLLIYLIQSQEVDVVKISLHKIIEQYQAILEMYQDEQMHVGAELLSTTALLIWLKSKSLLPTNINTQLDLEAEVPRFELIRYLLEYHSFKEVANFLLKQEDIQQQKYTRGVPELEDTLPALLPLPPMPVNQLTEAFQRVLNRVNPKSQRTIKEEPWRVSDKMEWLRHQIKIMEQIQFNDLFTVDRCKEEWIVTFLAILELMKIGIVGIDQSSPDNILLIGKQKEELK
ncbi:MAG: scpA [Chlamydiales bacterium]|jgi:segregation and condensation protein A|nr:scpA [Chlamydiales bacterium]